MFDRLMGVAFKVIYAEKNWQSCKQRLAQNRELLKGDQIWHEELFVNVDSFLQKCKPQNNSVNQRNPANALRQSYLAPLGHDNNLL